MLTESHGVTSYHYDLHHALGHEDRRIAHLVREGGKYEPVDPEDFWIRTTHAEMACAALELFTLRFEWVIDDLRALVSARPVVAEGWGLRPALVAPLLRSTRQMIVLVPTTDFQRVQFERLPYASVFVHNLSDVERAQKNRLARDRLLSEEAAESAEQLGIRVLRVDGTISADGVAELVADHFSPFLR